MIADIETRDDVSSYREYHSQVRHDPGRIDRHLGGLGKFVDLMCVQGSVEGIGLKLLKHFSGDQPLFLWQGAEIMLEGARDFEMVIFHIRTMNQSSRSPNSIVPPE